MSSKSTILNAIKNNNIVKEVPLPNIENFGITFENKFEQFEKVIQTVGGKALEVAIEDLQNQVKVLYPEAKNIICNIENTTLSTFDENAVQTPHELKDIDVAIIKGEFAVAENGAVWIKNPSNRHRALYFIANNIIIVVKKEDIVHNMHEAYEKIDFDNTGYGVFVSGPSKTADIEQSLVIGAHGPKSGFIFFI
ncbi:MAG: LutC/YkgG family protein [Candidatus Marinarcus sp.]|uniref:LutC/YkgG family protein n=1 Tax=Candidatus Marinarcus sp. TaxID=3100987 RepID=UPI003B006A78